MQSARLDGRVVTCHQPNRRLGRISGREAELIEAGSWPVPRLAVASHFRRLGVSFSQPTGRVGSFLRAVHCWRQAGFGACRQCAQRSPLPERRLLAANPPAGGQGGGTGET